MTNETWVVISPHEYLSERVDLDELESKVYETIRRESKVHSLSSGERCHVTSGS
jgi:hypothetical protein